MTSAEEVPLHLLLALVVCVLMITEG
jgi:hypothetical protein